MNKSLIKHSAFQMKRVFTKMVFALCFAFFFVGMGEMTAQTNASSLSQANPHEKIAERMDVEILQTGSVDYGYAATVLNNQLETAPKNEATSIEYRYYWLVAVDLNRFNVPLELSLIHI